MLPIQNCMRNTIQAQIQSLPERLLNMAALSLPLAAQVSIYWANKAK